VRLFELMGYSKCKACALAVLSVCLFGLCAPTKAQQSASFQGVVTDSTGAVISGADVTLHSPNGDSSTTTDDQGNFTLPAGNAGTLTIRYPGFSVATLTLTADLRRDRIQIRLAPAATNERIVVTAEGGQERVVPVPSSEFAIPRQEMDVSGSLVLDDILRQTPGTSLFRRSGSLYANPTSQGVSLRGLGASGASRAAVLFDGVPFNDPFGGWVYWNQVPRVSIESVQVIDGGASDTYGLGALSGVINITPRHERESFGTLETSFGMQDSPYLSFVGGVSPGDWTVIAATQVMRTHGYVLVSENQRGLVDIPAGTADLTGSLEISRTLGDQGGVFFRGSSFGESRSNGTPVTTNNTRTPLLVLGGDWTHRVVGSFSGRLYGSYEIFNQNFSSVAANRNSESLSNRQRSPSQQFGFAAQWRKTIARKHSVTAGVEDRDVRGHSAETTFNAAGAATAAVDAGGRQRTVGVFFQDAFYIAPKWLVTVGGRGDFSLDSRGFSNRLPLPAGAFTSSDFANRTENAFSPRVSVLRTFAHNVAVSGAIYRAFRAPTLNELYRNFRVGNVVTNANPALQAEVLTGGEAGASMKTWRNKVTLRGTFYWSDIARSIANVTLSTTPALITRQRQNLGSTRSRGAEFSTEFLLLRNLRISGGYIRMDSTVLSFPANTALEGLRVPQVPRNEFNVQVSYTNRNWTAGVQTRFLGHQFDDDQNLLRLDLAFIVDAELSRRLAPHTIAFVAAQNLFDNRYDIALTPVENLGPPVLIRGGFRFELR
jgi:outer membrane receptor protein involved in Fe transport